MLGFCLKGGCSIHKYPVISCHEEGSGSGLNEPAGELEGESQAEEENYIAIDDRRVFQVALIK
jgi:hypothetical protein